MMKAPSLAIWLPLATVLVACGGGEQPPAPGTPANLPAPTTAPAEPGAQASDTTPAAAAAGAQQAEAGLVREVFAYRGSGRDPFLSLLRSGGVRPLFEDLRLTAVTYDERYPGNSVAVLRDTVVNKAYTVRIGDEVGRLRVAEIRPDEVVMITEEFGVERQRSLLLRRRQQEVMP